MSTRRAQDRKPGGPDATTKNVRLVVALCAVLASAGCLIASLLVWLTVSDGASITGWGTMHGGQADGGNVNDALAGYASFRPGELAIVIGALALVAALGVALVARGDKPHRIPGALLALCGAGGIAWGLVRGLAPGDLAGVFAAAEGAAPVSTSSGAGPWLLAGCSLVLLAAAVVIFTGVLDPPRPLRQRGIQPR